MINGTLNLFIGLALTFGSVSLMVSSITEGVASLFSLRSNRLLSGIKDLLNDPNMDGLALAVLNHASANPLSDGNAKPGQSPSVVPAYIAPLQFASALIDSVHATTGGAPTADELRQAINANVQDPQIKALLLGVLARAGTDVAAFRQGLANWFDGAMERLSGKYKRYAQLISFGIASALAVLLNIDAIHIAQMLWAQPDFASHVQSPTGNWNDSLKEWTDTFPLGWSAATTFSASMVAGWLLTAAATLFGAPFWFDTLQRFVQVRSSGSTPAEQAKQASHSV